MCIFAAKHPASFQNKNQTLRTAVKGKKQYCSTTVRAAPTQSKVGGRPQPCPAPSAWGTMPIPSLAPCICRWGRSGSCRKPLHWAVPVLSTLLMFGLASTLRGWKLAALDREYQYHHTRDEHKASRVVAFLLTSDSHCMPEVQNLPKDRTPSF